MSLQYPGKDLEAMSFAQNYHQWILKEIAPYLGKIMAEVGAGVGNFSELLLNCSIEQLFAYEPADNLFNLLEKKLKAYPQAQAIHSIFAKQAPADFFDTICYINVLEHIEQDQQELLYAYEALKSGGHLLIFVPALSFLYSELDRSVGHYRRYSKKELVQKVQQAGFKIRKVKYFDMAGIIPWYIAFVLLKKRTTAANVSLYDRWVVPVMSRLEPWISPPIGKNLVLIAQKSGH